MSLFKCDIYDKNRNWLYPVGAFESVEGTVRFDNISDFEITVKATHNRLGAMLTPGNKLSLRFRDQVLIAGPIREHRGSGPGPSNTFTFGVEDHFRILRNYLVFQVPGGTMAQQANAYNYTITGNMETVFKDIVQKNIGSRGWEPIIIAPNLNRGATVTSSARMATVYNELFPLLEERGLGAKVTMTTAGLVVDVYQPGVYAGPKLTEQSRIIRKWKYDLKAPDVTNVIIGGGGEGTARIFQERYDVIRQDLWGDQIEVFRDARDTSNITVMRERGDETLFDGAGETSLEVQFGETNEFKFGGTSGVQVGQVVTAEVAGGAVSVTDILREVDFSWDAQDGLEIKGQIGRKVHPTAKMAQAISKLAGSFDKLKASQ